MLITITGCKKTNTDKPQQPSDANTVKDIDGNVYHMVNIGVQTWMVENLKTTHYRNGDAIAYSSTNLVNGSYCNYNDDASIAAVYGRLYNHSAIADNRGICPVGWHLPSA